jgi:hypothetical protein
MQATIVPWCAGGVTRLSVLAAIIRNSEALREPVGCACPSSADHYRIIRCPRRMNRPRSATSISPLGARAKFS